METHWDRVMQKSAEVFGDFQHSTGIQRKELLYKIAEVLESLGDALLQTAAEETNLPLARFAGERARTCTQMRLFGDVAAEGSWTQAVIDTAIPDRKPMPKPDMRKMLVPIGPVVVFGASNFPLAYAAPGGDTVSALAAGCTVVVKGHPAHPRTSALVNAAIQEAAVQCGWPAEVFQLVEDDSFECGKYLTQHDHTAAVGFTGSLSGGRAIFDYAQQREVPIPVFAEMGSTNPVLLLRDALQHQAPAIAKALAGSITLGVGQFCTNPGIILGIRSSILDHFTSLLAIELSLIPSFRMLHKGIYQQYTTKLSSMLDTNGVETIYHARQEGQMVASAVLVRVDGDYFEKNPSLHHEVFGPFSMIISCKNMAQLTRIWQQLHGQLTTTLYCSEKDLKAHPELGGIARSLAGRIVFNSVPTGVEVTHATVHGGPYPATTDSRFTSVGTDAILRWARPVCWQDCPDAWLPPALQNVNPLGIQRKVNGEFTRTAL